MALRSCALRLARRANEVVRLALLSWLAGSVGGAIPLARLQRLTYLPDLTRRSSAVLRIDLPWSTSGTALRIELTRLPKRASVAVRLIELSALPRRAARAAD